MQDLTIFIVCVSWIVPPFGMAETERFLFNLDTTRISVSIVSLYYTVIDCRRVVHRQHARRCRSFWHYIHRLKDYWFHNAVLYFESFEVC
jgi:hypothetical protein